MSDSLYITQAGRKLRCGYTTGSCAAAAAKAAALLLLRAQPVETVELVTPAGAKLKLKVASSTMNDDAATCAIQKDAGDDPDITNGILVLATVRKIPAGVRIAAGEGIGQITRPGLDQQVGSAAINSVPRRMITEAVLAASAAAGYRGGLLVTLSIPGGEALARRTFNPRLGIEGGLSIIGTTGIVTPMSHQALIDTVRLELRQLATRGGQTVILTPGKYGEAFIHETLRLPADAVISCSNFIGESIDAALAAGFSQILLVGHIGKLVKLGIGVTNTHSNHGDGRIETLLAAALAAGADVNLLRQILACVSTDAALQLLQSHDLLSGTLQILGQKIQACLVRRVPDATTIGFVCFTNAPGLSGVLIQSEPASTILEQWRKK